MKKSIVLFLPLVLLAGCVASTTPVFANSDLAPLTIAVHDNESGATVYMACKTTRTEVAYEKPPNKSFK